MTTKQPQCQITGVQTGRITTSCETNHDVVLRQSVPIVERLNADRLSQDDVKLRHAMTTPTPALPLVDGKLFLDNSALNLITNCPRETQYAFLQRRTSAGEKPALNFGEAVHLALAHRYTIDPQYTRESTEREMLDILTTYFQNHPPPEGQYRNLDLATKLIRKYNEHYACETFRVATLADRTAVEIPFAVRLGDMYIPHYDRPVDVIYCGRIDMCVLEDGHLYTLDHKTTFQFGDGFWADQSMSAQHLGYCWAIWQVTGTLPTGYIINGIRTRQPVKRNEDGSAKRSTRKEDVDETDFERQHFFIDTDKLDEWKFNTLDIVRNYALNVLSNVHPMHRKACVGKYGKCQFFEVCSLPREQRDMLLASDLYTDNSWSPLNNRGT